MPENYYFQHRLNEDGEMQISRDSFEKAPVEMKLLILFDLTKATMHSASMMVSCHNRQLGQCESNFQTVNAKIESVKANYSTRKRFYSVISNIISAIVALAIGWALRK